MGAIPDTARRVGVYLALMTSLLRLFEQLVADPTAKAQFREDSAGFLDEAGFGDLPLEHLAEALFHAADSFPPALAQAIDLEGGLEGLADLDLGALGLTEFVDFGLLFGPVDGLLEAFDLDDSDQDEADLDEADLDEAGSDEAGLDQDELDADDLGAPEAELFSSSFDESYASSESEIELELETFGADYDDGFDELL